MRRRHLVEIHDCPWCPRVLRDGLTDFLAESIATFDSYGPIRDKLISAIAETGASQVVDLCSGGGGPWAKWSDTVSGLPNVLLTDKFPNRNAGGNLGKGLQYCAESVDATAVPEHLTGFRTIFTAAHHFRPETVSNIIEDAVRQRQPIGIFELTHRSIRGFLFMLLSFPGVWLLTPRMSRINALKLLLTYPIPLIPLVTTIDGIVSCLRTYTPEELSSMGNAAGYRWQIGLAPGPATPVTYLIGIPE